MVTSLDVLLASIEEKEEKERESLAKRLATREYLSQQTKKVGKMRYTEKPIDFLYSDEIPTTMRKLKVGYIN